MKKINYRHYICIIITLGFVAVSVFVFPNALGRVIEGFRDFGLSIAYYFCEIFGIEYGFTPTVNDLPKTPFFPFLEHYDPPSSSLPETWDGFQSNWDIYWGKWADKSNFLNYLAFVGNLLYSVAKVLIIIVPFVIIIAVLFNRTLKKQNNDYDKDSKPLKIFKTVTKYTYRPVKLWLTDFFAFLRGHKGYLIAWACIWLYSFNALAIITEFFAYYFYFCISFDIASIYRQVYKLCLDLWAVIDFVPLWAWLIFGLWLTDRIRRKIAYERLTHYEMRDRGFINARPMVTMIVGTMGKGKTTILTDMCLSTEVMFRDRAFEKILQNDLKFPNFPWINLENLLRRAIADHTVYNLATVKKLIAKKRERWTKNPCREKLFGYDYERYGLTYDNKLETVDIWQVIETYAQLYFIYVIESSLLVSNYSIRTDCLLSDIGNFPLWNGDFFKRDSKLIDSFSRHSHILDFDFLRLGKTVIDNNKYRHALEFGVVAVSEIGKERRNALELREREVKAKDDKTNQKNDGFNDGLKMRRQAATVDNDCYLKIISDEQRPESFGADARDLFDVIHIGERSEVRLAMPFFLFGELLYSFIAGRFKRLYSKYRFNHGDNTLCMYLLKNVAAKAVHYYKGVYNLFGYNSLCVQVEKGTLDGAYEENKYYLSWKKIYSRRFATDCMSAFWTERAARSPVGLGDLREYETARATWEELKAQNSYFINDLISVQRE